jgi:hypothetical protein
MFLPSAGFRRASGESQTVLGNAIGYYWSSTSYSDTKSRTLYFNGNSALNPLSSNNNTNALPVRCVESLPIPPAGLTHIGDGGAGEMIGNPGGSSQTTTGTTYVGAFWRANQRGERIISIPDVPAGQWAVQVYSYGGRGIYNNDGSELDPTEGKTTLFKTGDIRFDISGRSGAATDNAELYHLDASYPTFIRGELASQGTLTFRMGLTSTYTPTATNPARYAVVAISYGGQKGNSASWKHQLLFLRQGHDPDYVMYPNLSGQSFNGTDYRGDYAMRWSPYNLTAQEFRDGTSMDSYVDIVTVRGAAFTEFPTQVGAHFQYANNVTTYRRRAYNPSIQDVSSYWNSTASSSTYWNTLGSTHETCPKNYLLSTGETLDFRRPYDNDISVNPAYNAALAETLQSLHSKTVASDPIETFTHLENSVWGRYADGFFDRNVVNSNDYAGTGPFVANEGRLYHNPLTHNSLFLPYTGIRDATDGTLNVNGAKTGQYWLANANVGSAYHIIISDDGNNNQGIDGPESGIATSPRSHGIAIRCVAFEPPA